MADESAFSTRHDNKRRLDDSPTAAWPARRPTGFSSPPADAQSAMPQSYNTVPPPPDGIQLAKQRAQEIAAKLFSEAGAKRPKVDNSGDESSDKGFSSGPSDFLQKPMGQQFATQGGLTSPASFPSYGFQSSSKKIEIPNGRVGVIIGKGGETIKYLQLQSGAKIQVTRDADSDPSSQTRNVELMGTAEQISKAEQLIKEVIDEADAGGSGTASARKYGGPQAGVDHFTMKVPNNKVGLIIGKGGETIKSMQAKSGARIQLIPLHLPPGDTSTERNLHIDGTPEQIELAKQLAGEITSENRVKNPSMGGYPPQYGAPRAPSWGPSGPPPMQQPGYGYMQPGTYPGQPPQYNMSQSSYGGYPPAPTSGGYSSGWDQSSNPPAQQTAAGSGYEYYTQGNSSAPADNNSGYNYGQPPTAYNSQGSYGDAYAQSAGVAQQPNQGQDSYSGGYQAPAPQPGYSQPVSGAHPGYDQQGYGSTPAYGGPPPNPASDGSASTYGTQGGASHVPPAQQVPPVQQSSTPPGAQGYTVQQPSTNTGGFPSAQTGYNMPTPTSQAGYTSQTPQSGYGQSGPMVQPSYGQGQRPPAYSQGQQPQSAQAGYSTGTVQPGYGQLPPAQAGYAQDSVHHRGSAAGFAPGGSQAGYGQQQSYAAPPQNQPPYSQQPYGDTYSGGGYSQPPAFSSDGTVNGAGDAPASQSASGATTKASPKS
ncbi:hypothetical protein J5N97_025739 [Dioscorea zingiberensis]|uniref:K Homology domain-containing protein n=1 Tax=Dioscorea zingiberensis TaxID=325984 RepID=A0A9D5C177_9LILI|nr:hypothetical protein J5N97_025739 [Dioscorea zingiberensis]